MGMRPFFDSTALVAAGLAAWLASPLALAVEMNARQADVARRGALVMPFDLAKTRHVFTKTPSGGVQRVMARDAGDSEQGLIRAMASGTSTCPTYGIREIIRDHILHGSGWLDGGRVIHKFCANPCGKQVETRQD